MIRDIGPIESIRTIAPEADGQTRENFDNSGVLIDPDSINVALVLSQLLDVPSEEVSQKMITIATNIGLGLASSYRTDISANHDDEPKVVVRLVDEGGVVRILDSCMGRSILLSARP